MPKLGEWLDLAKQALGFNTSKYVQYGRTSPGLGESEGYLPGGLDYAKADAELLEQAAKLLDTIQSQSLELEPVIAPKSVQINPKEIKNKIKKLTHVELPRDTAIRIQTLIDQLPSDLSQFFRKQLGKLSDERAIMAYISLYEGRVKKS